jgi:hypothetical protein
MRKGNQTSTGAIMCFIGVVALELALFQEVWFIVLSPPITMAILAMNLGFLFLILHPMPLESRIIGILMGGVAASFAMVIGLDANTGKTVVHLQNFLLNWASGVLDQQSLTAIGIQFFSAYVFVVFLASSTFWVWR